MYDKALKAKLKEADLKCEDCKRHTVTNSNCQSKQYHIKASRSLDFSDRYSDK